METQELVGRELKGIWIAARAVHPAWVDSTTPALASGFANLDFAEMQTVKVQPREVQDIPGMYPSLGIEILSVPEPPTLHLWPEGGEVRADPCPDAEQFLPSRIASVRMWDALGEGVDSALTLVLENGRTVVIRHIYPPMTLGIEFGHHEV